MVMLLARYANYELDQWEMWKISTQHGPVFVTLANSLPEGAPTDAFQPVWPLPDQLR
jgi:hypothetical protein